MDGNSWHPRVISDGNDKNLLLWLGNGTRHCGKGVLSPFPIPDAHSVIQVLAGVFMNDQLLE